MINKKIVAIAAVDMNNGIGKDDNLLFRISRDIQRFKELTTGNIVLMGRKTFETLPNKKGLPDRENIVLTRDPNYEAENARVINNLEEYINEYRNTDNCKCLYIIGGAEVYNQALQYCDYIDLTKVYSKFDADKFFPKINPEEWRLAVQTNSYHDDKTDLSYRFNSYVRL